MGKPAYEIRLCAPDEEASSWALEGEVWNPFNWMAEGAVGIDYDPELHYLAVNPDHRLLATIDAHPMEWDGDPRTLPEGGWTELIERAEAGFERRPAYAFAVGASVREELRGTGVAGELLTALRDRALSLGYRGLVAPVLPSARWRCPRLTTAAYAALRLPDMRHFDPWIRVHERIGGRIIGSCPISATFRAPRSDWERWFGVRLPSSGSIVLEGAGELELAFDTGLLIQESIWILHGPEADAAAEQASALAAAPSPVALLPSVGERLLEPAVSSLTPAGPVLALRPGQALPAIASHLDRRAVRSRRHYRPDENLDSPRR